MTDAFRIYDPEAATNLYAELQDSYRQLPRYRLACRMLNQTLQKCLNENTAIPGVRFNGAFAKADYLLKEHGAPRDLRQTLNDARVRLRRLGSLTDDELRENFLYDLQAVARFVALVYQMPVPGVLEAVFPAARRRQKGTLRAEYLRLIVNSWDESYIYATADAENTDELKVFYGGKSDAAVYKDWDWSYLRHLLREGCQLNIVRPREHDGVLFPELFVWEPDFLVDISSVAACFENYAVSPLNHLLGKLKPSPNSQPIVLGNLASQFLDEELSPRPEGHSYAQSVRRFFRDNALSLLTAGIGADFHAQAQSQQLNIRETLQRKLPALLSREHMRFDSSEIMVEPSFFSEMLGLQGRMDFLQLGRKVLIEQKSGKAGFPETDPPREQQKHYVQLLLYMLLVRYNFRRQYEQNQHQLYAFLLYSKYREGLLPLGFAPDLVFAAMEIRNRMAAAEYGYSRDGLALLGRLSADMLNENHVGGALWERWQKPQIDALLQPVGRASTLERAYYLRFLQFVETEHLMAKVGNQTKENSGFADKWHSSLDEKLQAGNIYCGLELISPAQTDRGRVEQVTLAFTERPDHEISNFRTGDIVILYPYQEGTEPDARQTMVFRATIGNIGPGELVLNLRAAQSGPQVFWYEGHRLWAVEHDFVESSFSSLYRGMHAFLSAPKERRDLLLLQRRPRVDKALRLTGSYGAFDDLALRAKQAAELFLIIGPPGTGKTSYGLLNTLQEELASTQESVLLLSYTNRAVDEICSKLLESGIAFIRIGGRLACETAYRPYLLDSLASHCSHAAELKSMLVDTRVVVGTTTALNAHIHLFGIKRFGLAIIDEASQILEPHLAGLLSATAADGTCAIRKIILIGDHKQLPAVVQQRAEESAVGEPELRAIHLTDCRLSLFERLLKQYRDDPEVTYMLTRQGRMHPDIARFPNYAFYQNRLREVPLQHQKQLLPPAGRGIDGIDDLLTTRRIAFVAVENGRPGASDKVNADEARVIAATVVHVFRLEQQRFDALQTVGVIVPYRNQIAEIRNVLETYAIEALRHITIDTVERYQGSQRDYIIYGFTIQQYYQLAFLSANVFEEDGSIIDRKLNVAMTRAREHLVLVGNPSLLANNITFYKLMEDVRSRQGYFSVAPDDYISGRFAVPPLESRPDSGTAHYDVGPLFAQAFGKLVAQPVADDPRTARTGAPFGRSDEANLDIIAYGRADFSRPRRAFGDEISASEQVLLYAYYLMRRSYCAGRVLFGRYKEWLSTLVEAHGGRLRLVDIGCGPATAGIAFGEELPESLPSLSYIGIDVAEAMRQMGSRFLAEVFDRRLHHHRFVAAFDELPDSYWQAASQLPSLVVFTVSYAFAALSAQQAEQMARQIAATMRSYTLNRYVIIVQYGDGDARLNSYQVFRRVLSPCLSPCKSGRLAFTTRHGQAEQQHEFCYDIMM